MLYVSLGEFDKRDNFLGQVHSQFKNYFKFVEALTEDEPGTVRHETTGKEWTVLKTFPESDKGMRAWVV